MAERYIGIDFGTSNSLVRVMQYEDGKPIEKSLDPKPVTFKNGQETTVPTRVRMKESAEDIPPTFGHAATRKRGYVIHENFKTDLESSNPEVRARARKLTEEFFDFMGKTYRHQSECGLFGNVDDKVHTIVSYPVKWSEDTRSFMVEAARKAGFPDVTGMDEAKAAIQAVAVMSEGYLLQKGLLKKDQAVTILLIDMGAGTTDLVLCSYTPGKNAQILSTWPKGGEIFFGGKEIDDKLPQFFQDEKVIEPQEILETTLARLGSSEFKAWKENTVSPVLENNDVVSEFTALENLINFQQQYTNIVEKDYALDRAAFEKVLGKDLEKFPQLVNGCLADAKVHGSDVDLVILTGGHSQWYFVKEMLAGKMPQYGKLELTKVMADPARIIQIARPQETVARGLVYTPLCSKEIAEPEDLYQQGLELEKSDPKKANELYLQAAELGHAGAMNRLGYNCKFGIGTTKDFEKAILWYQKAADLGYAKAMYNLGVCHANGTGVLKNAEKAVEWYQKAADLGYAGAMNWLGIYYENGEGVTKNQEKANELYQKAAELGDANGMYNFALSNLYGKGIPANPRLALEWLEKAAALGQPSAKKYAEEAPESEFEVVKDGDNCIIKKYLGNRSIVSIPAMIGGKKVVAIGDHAFCAPQEGHLLDVNEINLNMVIIPESVKRIGHAAFFKCIELHTVIAHEFLEQIDSCVFMGCKNLRQIDFGMGPCPDRVVKFPKEMKKIGGIIFERYNFVPKSECIINKVYVSKKTVIAKDAFKNISSSINYYTD